jgi:ribonuclease HII
VFASAEEIDAYNIRGAALRAMAQAVRTLSLKPDLVLIDGRDIPDGLACRARAIIGRDAPSMSIATASIIRQNDARCAHAQLEPRVSAVWLCRSRRLCDGASPARAGGFRPCPYHRRSFRLTEAEDAI